MKKNLISMLGLAAALALGGSALLAGPAALAQDKAGEMKKDDAKPADAPKADEMKKDAAPAAAAAPAAPPAAASAGAAAAAPAAGAAAPAAGPAAAPKCGDKGFDCNKGDVAWMMTSSAFVLFMTVPGLALFYAGMVRRKNALSTVMQSFAIFCVVAVLWVIYGYSASFTAGGSFIGSMDKLFMQGEDPATAVAATFSKGQYLPDFVYCMFQLTFAAITVALICGGLPSASSSRR